MRRKWRRGGEEEKEGRGGRGREVGRKRGWVGGRGRGGGIGGDERRKRG